MRSLRTAIIGCGAHARSVHGPSLMRCASERAGVHLAAACDLDAARAERFAREFGFAAAYADIDRMLEREKPDALLLVVPPEKTCDVACRMLERGIPLLMEKPPGMDEAETDRMIAAADRGRAPHMVAVNRRFMPLVRALKERLDAEPAGGIHHIDYEFVRVNRRDRDFSTTAIHGIDAVRFLAGADYASVRFTFQPAAEAPPASNVFMDGIMTNGVTVRLRFLPVSGALVERATVYAADRMYELRMAIPRGLDGAGRLRCLERYAVKEEISGPGADGDGLVEAAGVYGENAAFLDALSDGRAPYPDLSAIRQSVAVTACFRARRPEYCEDNQGERTCRFQLR